MKKVGYYWPKGSVYEVPQTEYQRWVDSLESFLVWNGVSHGFFGDSGFDNRDALTVAPGVQVTYET